MKTRREFLSQVACSSCLLIAGATGLTLLQNSAAAKVVVGNDGNVITVPLSSFSNAQVVVVDRKKEGSVLVRKKDDGTFIAFSLICSHRGGRVAQVEDGLKCPRHGSKFDLDGHVTKGPAKTNLPQYATSIEGDNVVVTVN